MTNVDINAEITTLKRSRPQTVAEQRVRATELCRLEGILHEAARKAIDASATKRPTGGNGAKPAAGKHVVTAPELNAVIDIVAKAVGEDRLRLDALEKRIAELEARPRLKDAGVWDETRIFHPGDIISHDGSGWICKVLNSRSKPGETDCWRLFVKRGRDARGSR